MLCLYCWKMCCLNGSRKFALRAENLDIPILFAKCLFSPEKSPEEATEKSRPLPHCRTFATLSL